MFLSSLRCTKVSHLSFFLWSLVWHLSIDIKCMNLLSMLIHQREHEKRSLKGREEEERKEEEVFDPCFLLWSPWSEGGFSSLSPLDIISCLVCIACCIACYILAFASVPLYPSCLPSLPPPPSDLSFSRVGHKYWLDWVLHWIKGGSLLHSRGKHTRYTRKHSSRWQESSFLLPLTKCCKWRCLLLSFLTSSYSSSHKHTGRGRERDDRRELRLTFNSVSIPLSLLFQYTNKILGVKEASVSTSTPESSWHSEEDSVAKGIRSAVEVPWSPELSYFFPKKILLVYLSVFLVMRSKSKKDVQSSFHLSRRRRWHTFPSISFSSIRFFFSVSDTRRRGYRLPLFTIFDLILVLCLSVSLSFSCITRITSRDHHEKDSIRFSDDFWAWSINEWTAWRWRRRRQNLWLR